MTNTATVRLIRGDEIEPERIAWLWPGWLAKGKLAIVAGSPATGKTTLCLAIGAALSRGAVFPGGAAAPRASVLMWSGEDAARDTLLPRFVANGGDAARIHFVDERHGGTVFDPARDMAALAQAAARIEDLGLLILDPIASVVAGDSHRNAEVRRALAPLIRLAEERGVAILGITHFAKGTANRDPLERVLGSIALPAAGRMLWVTAHMKLEDGQSGDVQAGDESRFLLVRAKNNLGREGDGFAYRLAAVALPGLGDIESPRVDWGEALYGSARALLRKESRGPGRTEACEQWLMGALRNGRADVTNLKDQAEAAGHAWPTIRRARQNLKRRGIEIEAMKPPERDAGWIWVVARKPAGESEGDQTR